MKLLAFSLLVAVEACLLNAGESLTRQNPVPFAIIPVIIGVIATLLVMSLITFQ